MGTIEFLTEKAKNVRKDVLEMSYTSGLDHFVPSLSCVDILVAIYYSGIFTFKCDNIDERDRFVLSKGHANTALYSILSDLGYFSRNELNLMCKGGILGGHPDHTIPGVEVVSGSLGNGLGIAAGMALRAKLDGKNYNTISLIGDGECYEGSIWESMLFIGQHKLNMIVIIDCNGMSATDFTYTGLSPDSLASTFAKFGFEYAIIDGHNFKFLLETLKQPATVRPLVIIAETIKGKGVSFTEGRPEWHTKIPSGDKLQQAKQELYNESNA